MATDERVTEHNVQSEGLGGETAGTGKKNVCAFGCKLKRQNLFPSFESTCGSFLLINNIAGPHYL